VSWALFEMYLPVSIQEYGLDSVDRTVLRGIEPRIGVAHMNLSLVAGVSLSGGFQGRCYSSSTQNRGCGRSGGTSSDHHRTYALQTVSQGCRA